VSASLSQAVVAGLKSRILDGSLGPGEKLPSEADLIEEFSVSRTVIREAVTRLRAEGLVETFHGRGSFVLAVPEPTSFQLEAAAIRNHHDVLAMVDFRIGVESEAAALAAAHVDPRGARAIRDALDASEPPSPSTRWRRTSRSTGPWRPPRATASTSTCSTRSAR
jgi:GntR family transcriptional repressor for pyruvate dehydrogenase complex